VDTKNFNVTELHFKVGLSNRTANQHRFSSIFSLLNKKIFFIIKTLRKGLKMKSFKQKFAFSFIFAFALGLMFISTADAQDMKFRQ